MRLACFTFIEKFNYYIAKQMICNYSLGFYVELNKVIIIFPSLLSYFFNKKIIFNQFLSNPQTVWNKIFPISYHHENIKVNSCFHL